MMIDSTDLIRKLPAMLQGRRKFARVMDGNDYHIGEVDNWCLRYAEVVQGIEDYCGYKETRKYTLSAPIDGNWDVLNAYPYKEGETECLQCNRRHSVLIESNQISVTVDMLKIRHSHSLSCWSSLILSSSPMLSQGWRSTRKKKSFYSHLFTMI